MLGVPIKNDWENTFLYWIYLESMNGKLGTT